MGVRQRRRVPSGARTTIRGGFSSIVQPGSGCGSDPSCSTLNSSGKIVDIEVTADPQRMRRLDLAVLA